MRRDAISIPSNIAEGAARQHNKEFIQFLYISLGSLAELETQIELAVLLGFNENSKEVELLNENTFMRRMLLKLIQSIK